MSSIQINRGTKAEIDNTPVTDGLICFQTDDNFIYMDNGDTREAFGGVKVIPNPQEEPTEVLRNLQIADDVYKISGGHEIEDQSGTTLTQRDVMRFTGAYSHDDSTSEVTKIDVVREMTVAQKDTLTGDEVEGFQWTTDENNDLPLTTDWVAYRDGQSATEALDDAIKEVLSVKTIMDTEALTITYTQNNYVSSVDACSAYKKNNTLYFNLNIGVSGSPTPDFVEIGRIAGWTAPKQLQMQVVGQSATFTMVTVNITTSGVIQLYFPMTIGSTTNFRQNSSQVLI